MGDGTFKNPYTREDVLRLIKEHGNTADGLDLSGKYFKDGIDLRGLDLQGIILKKANFFILTSEEAKNSVTVAGGEGAHLEGTRLQGAHLEGANLLCAHLEGAGLSSAHLEEVKLGGAELNWAGLASAHLEGADLMSANLDKAELSDACLEGAYLYEARFSTATALEDADWGNYILGEEREGDKERFKSRQRFLLGLAETTYRRLKIWHTEHGLYNIAGKFFYREMEAKRKAQSWKKKPLLKLWSWVLRILCGYGEKPERVVISAATIVFGLALAYFLWGSFSSSSFTDTLYYSVASFTALGYGQWAPQPTGWAKGMGAAEAVLGVSILALFLVTFTRKMIR